jgi:hypothetical protein
VAYATRSDFGDALRDHRGWVASIALLLVMFVASAFACWIVLSIIGLDANLALLLTISVLGAFGWAWLDAAHRIAGRRGRG